MKKTKWISLIPVLVLAIVLQLSVRMQSPSVLVARTHSGSQAIEQEDASKTSYDKVASMRGSNGQNMLIVLIAVKPEDFTREAMIQLAHQLNQDYKEEQWVHAAIFDSPKAARNYNPAGGSYYVSKDLERGEYVLNRINRCEYINYSSARGKPIRENLIMIHKSPSSKRKVCPERIEF